MNIRRRRRRRSVICNRSSKPVRFKDCVLLLVDSIGFWRGWVFVRAIHFFKKYLVVGMMRRIIKNQCSLNNARDWTFGDRNHAPPMTDCVRGLCILQQRRSTCPKGAQTPGFNMNAKDIHDAAKDPAGPMFSPPPNFHLRSIDPNELPPPRMQQPAAERTPKISQSSIQQ